MTISFTLASYLKDKKLIRYCYFFSALKGFPVVYQLATIKHTSTHTHTHTLCFQGKGAILTTDEKATTFLSIARNVFMLFSVFLLPKMM